MCPLLAETRRLEDDPRRVGRETGALKDGARSRTKSCSWFFFALLGAFSLAEARADLADAERQFRSGNYADCVKTVQKELQDEAGGEDRYLLLSKALLNIGHYAEALQSITNALAKDPRSIRLRWQAREVFQCNGKTDAADEAVQDIFQRVSLEPRAYRDPPNLVVFGQAALLRNADPKRVLDQVFDSARKTDPKLRDVYLASGELALEKHDLALAAKRFREGLKEVPDDPDLHFGLARAYAPSDSALMAASIDAALEGNSNHIGCLLLLTDHSIDAEDYEQARELLDRIKTINPWQPEAWAYRAVLAHLQNELKLEGAARQTALQFWPNNPKVDYLIGRKLSQNYRFAEGAAHQKQALQYASDYLPAKGQLAQDLLRLGEEAEGWRLAQELQKQDSYDVEAYNLAALRDTMAKFATLTNRDFIVRMNSREAAVYGTQVLELLGSARSNLCAKYGIEVKRPTIVEVFAEQKDFAVRTFGMPGNAGFLGVCFGNVVTANSPAAQVGHAVNWRAVLWHEFCHVVTLQTTRNKMPRWLSEGISVYEERQANPSWGQRMNPRYREMILEGEMAPVSKLSASFLAPKSDFHLQFAYFESSLAVEFMMKRFGLERFKALLGDLANGAQINQAIQKQESVRNISTNSGPSPDPKSGAEATLAKFDDEFAAFARDRAAQLAPGLDWERWPGDRDSAKRSGRRSLSRVKSTRPQDGEKGAEDAARREAASATTSPESWEAWATKHPTNFWVLTRRSEELVEAKQWSDAKPLLEKLLQLYPGFTGPESSYRLLAETHRALSDTNAERQVLMRFAQQDDEAIDAYLRLMELGEAARDWPVVAQNARRYLAVNPLTPVPYRFLAQASQQLADYSGAISACNALLELEPSDPAEVHFRLAKLHFRTGSPEARRHLLQALEEAPRYREALGLLLEMDKQDKSGKQRSGL